MNKNKYELIHMLIKQDKAAEALIEFNRLNHENSSEYWMLKGKIEMKFQKWGEAMNAFIKVLDIDKQNKEAMQNIEIIRGILNFWNPEMFNP